MSLTIDYYHFLISPWSYLSIGRFNALREQHGLTVRVKPIAVLPTFERMGGQPPAKRHPSRQRWRMDELRRWKSFLDLPLNETPAHFPTDQTRAACMVYAAGGIDASPAALQLSDAVLTAVWAQERDIADEPTLIALADGVGLDGPALYEQAMEPQWMEQYEAITNEAHERDVFGSPTWVLPDGERFWGQDRLDFLQRAIAPVKHWIQGA